MLADNLKYLRKQRNRSQQQVANDLDIPRTTLGDYERGHTEPSIETLARMASYFDISIDELLLSDLSDQSIEIIRADNMRILAVSVDSSNRQNIEFVSARARAGYLESFQDPHYIQELPKMYFPSIPEGTYRAFEIQGDSMIPMMPGSVVICSYVERLDYLKNDRTYVIATHLDGIVYKRIVVNPDKSSVTAISDNPSYPPYRIAFRDIAEIWQYYAHISFTDARQAINSTMEGQISDIQEKVTYIKQQLEQA